MLLYYDDPATRGARIGKQMAEAQAARPKQEIGLAVEDFSLPLIGGSGRRSLSDYLDGTKGAVMVFWSGVCSHCLRYDEFFNSFAGRHSELGFVGIASRHGESAQQIQQTAAERKLAFPILHDAGGAVARQWYAQQTPRAFLIGADRTLLYRGAIDNFKMPGDAEYIAYLEPAIEAFLSGRRIERSETASFGCAIQSVYYILPKPI